MTAVPLPALGIVVVVPPAPAADNPNVYEDFDRAVNRNTGQARRATDRIALAKKLDNQGALADWKLVDKYKRNAC